MVIFGKPLSAFQGHSVLVLRSDITGICPKKSILADTRKEDGLEGRDQVEGPFYDSRKKYDSAQ